MTTSKEVIAFTQNGDAWSIAWEYLKKGVQAIDSMFGEGYAKAHPELLAAFLNASSQNHIAEALMIDYKRIDINNLSE